MMYGFTLLSIYFSWRVVKYVYMYTLVFMYTITFNRTSCMSIVHVHMYRILLNIYVYVHTHDRITYLCKYNDAYTCSPTYMLPCTRFCRNQSMTYNHNNKIFTKFNYDHINVLYRKHIWTNTFPYHDKATVHMVTIADKGYHFQKTYIYCVQGTHDMYIFVRLLHDNVSKLDSSYDELFHNQSFHCSI